MSVLGFDFGNQSCYVATARSGGIEMIFNDYSLRDTPTYVSFNPTNRSLGVAARNQLLQNTTNTLYNFKRFIGRKFKDPFVQQELKYITYKVEEMADGGVGIKTHHLGQPVTLSVEQVTAMLLSKLKFIAENDIKIAAVDCVISIPVYFTDVERRAMMIAAQTAGLNPLRLMNDTTAVALTYGLYSQELPEQDKPPKHIIFVDVGYASTQIAAVAFNKGKLKMLAIVFDPHLGGRNFDYALVNYFAADFKDRYRIDVWTKPRAVARLRDECEKLKKLMSANATDIPMNLECFFEDKDVNGKVKREKFEELIAPELQQLESKMREILKELNWTPENVDRVEIVGGSTRVPAVKTLIKKVFDKEPSTSLNQDEAVARGCAIQCAILSPTFKVKEFSVVDVNPYAIQVSWPQSRDVNAGSLEVFGKNHSFPCSKYITLQRSEPFALDAQYVAGQAMPYPDLKLGSCRVSDVKVAPGENRTKVRVKARLNLNGTFSLVQATSEETVMVEVEVPASEAAAVDSAKMDVDAEQDPDSAKSGDQTADTEAQPTPRTEPPSNEKMDIDDPTNDEKPKEEKVKRMKKQVKTIEMPIEYKTPSYDISAKLLNEYAEFENELRMQDKREKEKVDAKNELETFIYDARDKISQDNNPQISDVEREKFSEQLRQMGDWLYEEGDDQPKDVYMQKLFDLQVEFAVLTKRDDKSAEKAAAEGDSGQQQQPTQ